MPRLTPVLSLVILSLLAAPAIAAVFEPNDANIRGGGPVIEAPGPLTVPTGGWGRDR